MPWYVFALSAMFVSVWTPILTKWALNYGIDKIKLLTYIFTGMFCMYLIYNLAMAPTDFLAKLHTLNFLAWGLLVGALSLAGNFTSFVAYERSPNPGYVQSVIVTNVLLVLILSVSLLGAPINLVKAMGTLVVIAGLITLFLGKKTAVKGDQWGWPAFTAAVCFGLMYLVVKKMTSLEISPAEILVMLFFWASLGFLALSFRKRINLIKLQAVPKMFFLLVILYLLIGFGANLLNFTAIRMAPNPGYSTAIFNSSVVLTLLFSRLVFPKEAGGEFSARKWIGAIITFIGVATIVLG